MAPQSSTQRTVELTSPTTEILRARALNALHTYVAQRFDYDHRRATPAFNRIAESIERQLADLEATVKPRAESDRPR